MFICSEVDVTSCQRTQSVSYQGRKCGLTECVSIMWKYDNEWLDYRDFTDTVYECNLGCGCPTGMVQTTAKKSTGKVTTAKITTTTTRTTQKTTSSAQTSLVSSEETTNPQEYRTAETNATIAAPVSDGQNQNDPVPIIVGVVVAVIVLAIIAAVAVFLWKRKKSAAHKAGPVCHEYANLPGALACTKESDATTNVVNSNQNHPSQYVNYDIDNCSFENDHAKAKYFNQSNYDIVDKQNSDNQLYANCKPSRSLAVASTDCSQPENASCKINGGFVSFSNTLEESDDFTKSIYAQANDTLINDNEHTAGTSSSNTNTHSSDFHSDSNTNGSHTNSRTAISSAKSHPYERQIIKNDSGYSFGKTHKYSETAADLNSLDNTGNPAKDYDYANQVDSTNSVNEHGYSISNSDFSSNTTTYSMAATPANNVVTTDVSPSQVYAKLGKDKHHFVNPYNVLQQTNEAPIPKQANIKQFNQDTLQGETDPYSVAEPISENPPQNDNIYSFQVVDSAALDDQYASTNTNGDEIVPGTIHPELLNQLTSSSRSQQSNDRIYFELEQES